MPLICDNFAPFEKINDQNLHLFPMESSYSSITQSYSDEEIKQAIASSSHG